MKPLEQWTLRECVDICADTNDCEDCLLEPLCGKSIDRWEPEQRFTQKELEAMRTLSKLGINYLARDSVGTLIWFQNAPIKDVGGWGWIADGDCGTLPREYFKLVQWSDDEPLEIKAMLESFS